MVARAPLSILIWLALAPCTGLAVESVDQRLQQTFVETVQPFVETYCLECHDREVAEADLDLSAFTTVDEVTRGHERWNLILERLEAGEMPPEEASSHPTPEAREAVIRWIRTLRDHVATQNAGGRARCRGRRRSASPRDRAACDSSG